MELKIDFTMGADPEFACVDNNGVFINASDFLHPIRDEMGLSEGCSDGVFPSHQFGADGSGRPFEVRPKPSVEPLEVVENLSYILRNSALQDPRLFRYDWHAGSACLRNPLGGHIHFGVKDLKIEGILDAVDVLDTYLGSITSLIEGEGGSYRHSTGYGNPGGFRQQPHGFEYRTPGSWLTSPYVSAGCLCLGKVIMAEVMNNPKFSPKWHMQHAKDMEGPYNDYDEVMGRTLHFQRTPRAGLISRLLLSSIREKFSAIWGDITQMMLYQEYKPYVDVLYFLVSHKLTWEPKVGMKQAWGVEEIKQRIPRSMPMDLIWSRYRQEVCHG